MTIRDVAVIGAGTMGNGIAHVFALHGHPVSLIDSDPAALRKGMDAIARNLERQVGKQAISAEDRDAALELAKAMSGILPSATPCPPTAAWTTWS